MRNNNNPEIGDINVYCVIGEKETKKGDEGYKRELLKIIEKVEEFSKKSLEGNLEVK